MVESQVTESRLGIQMTNDLALDFIIGFSQLECGCKESGHSVIHNPFQPAQMLLHFRLTKISYTKAVVPM